MFSVHRSSGKGESLARDHDVYSSAPETCGAVSKGSLCTAFAPSAKMVSKASDDFPLPESPVKTRLSCRYSAICFPEVAFLSRLIQSTVHILSFSGYSPVLFQPAVFKLGYPVAKYDGNSKSAAPAVAIWRGAFRFLCDVLRCYIFCSAIVLGLLRKWRGC